MKSRKKPRSCIEPPETVINLRQGQAQAFNMLAFRSCSNAVTQWPPLLRRFLEFGWAVLPSSSSIGSSCSCSASASAHTASASQAYVLGPLSKGAAHTSLSSADTQLHVQHLYAAGLHLPYVFQDVSCNRPSAEAHGPRRSRHEPLSRRTRWELELELVVAVDLECGRDLPGHTAALD